jgi:hypothetical protein
VNGARVNDYQERAAAAAHSSIPQKEWLISADECGAGGKSFYGFGSLWMPWQRRDDFPDEFWDVRRRSGLPDIFEVKWNKLDGTVRVASARNLIEWFFRRPWLMFRCLVVRKADVDKSAHGGTMTWLEESIW